MIYLHFKGGLNVFCANEDDVNDATWGGSGLFRVRGNPQRVDARREIVFNRRFHRCHLRPGRVRVVHVGSTQKPFDFGGSWSAFKMVSHNTVRWKNSTDPVYFRTVMCRFYKWKLLFSINVFCVYRRIVWKGQTRMVDILLCILRHSVYLWIVPREKQLFLTSRMFYLFDRTFIDSNVDSHAVRNHTLRFAWRLVGFRPISMVFQVIVNKYVTTRTKVNTEVSRVGVQHSRAVLNGSHRTELLH